MKVNKEVNVEQIYSTKRIRLRYWRMDLFVSDMGFYHIKSLPTRSQLINDDLVELMKHWINKH